MEEIATNVFYTLQIELPYVYDKQSKSKEIESRAVVREALKYIKTCLKEIPDKDDDLANAIACLSINLEVQPWNDGGIVTEATSMYKHLMALYRTNSKHYTGKPEAFALLKQKRNICLKINKLISSTLKRGSWQNYATICHLYLWYCHQLAFPLISDYLDILLPPSLNLVDSHDDGLKVLGVKSLYHVLNEAGKTELRWHGRAQVIFDAFQKLTYTKHEPLLVELHPAIIKVLEILNDDPDATMVGKLSMQHYVASYQVRSHSFCKCS